MNRRYFLLLAASSSAISAASHPALALFGVGDVCANCATFAQQLIDYAKQAQQALTQVSQLQTELQQYATMITNSISIPQMLWSNVTGDIQQIRGLANAASLLTGNAGGLLSRLNQAGGYFNSLSMTPQELSNQFSMWQTTFGNASQSLARTLGVQQGQEQNYAALQARLQIQGQTAAGQKQALDVANENLNLMNTQLQQTQTTLTAMAQEMATRDMVDSSRDAEQNQATEQFLNHNTFTGQGAEQWR